MVRGLVQTSSPTRDRVLCVQVAGYCGVDETFRAAGPFNEQTFCMH